MSYEPRGAVRGLMPQTVLGGGLRELAAVCTMCNDAEIGYSDGQYTRVGEPTEAAAGYKTVRSKVWLLLWVRQCTMQ